MNRHGASHRGVLLSFALTVFAFAGCARSGPKADLGPAAPARTHADGAPLGEDGPAPLLDAAAPSDADADADGGVGHKSIRADVPDVHFGKVVLGNPPDSRATRGTVVALGFRYDDSVAVYRSSLFEFDVATGEVLKEQSIRRSTEGEPRLDRDAALIHVGLQEDTTFEWITYDLSLAEVKRIPLSGVGAKELLLAYDEFAVKNGRAIVVAHAGERRTGVVYVFGGAGELVGKHNCAPYGFMAPAWPTIYEGDGQIVISGFRERGSEVIGDALCAFRADGRGPTVTTSFDFTADFFAANGHLYRTQYDSKNGETFFAADAQLHRHGAPIPNPRPALPARRCKIDGDYVQSDFWAWSGVEVISTGEEMSNSDGLFFCPNDEVRSPPPAGTRGTFSLGE